LGPEEKEVKATLLGLDMNPYRNKRGEEALNMLKWTQYRAILTAKTRIHVYTWHLKSSMNKTFSHALKPIETSNRSKEKMR